VIYCEASFYDYYSDSQVGRGSTPLAITDAEADGRHGHFNRRILELMKYGNTSVNPAKYPLYLGNFFANSSGADYDKIVSQSSDILDETFESTRLKSQNPYGNGHCAEVIENIISNYFK
jgi:hypothetical protein